MFTKQIHAKAPVRVCDIGGWTDTWFAGRGAVFNIAVKPEVEVTVNTFPCSGPQRVKLRLRNYDYEYTLDIGSIVYDKHPLIEAVIDSMEIPSAISLEIDIFSSIPAGASVGTSAALCVALTAALDALAPGQLTAHQIADHSHHVEMEKLNLQSGIQDQLCCAYGGINFIEMTQFPFSTVTPITPPPGFLAQLEQRLALVYIGTPHNSSDVHKMVIKDLGENAEEDPRLEGLRRLAYSARDAVVAGNLVALGEVMKGNTELQRQLHPGLVCQRFEELMEIADSFDVLGSKVNGAGGDGGSITLLGDGDREKKEQLLKLLKQKGFHCLPITLSDRGVTVEAANRVAQ